MVPDEESAKEIAREIGYPVMIKAAEGGGGRGMRIVRSAKELIPAFRTARTEAEQAFGSPNVYMEKLIERPRHIEFQVLGDKHGNVMHLGERECSLQRRHQKVLEESPSVAVDASTRQKLGKQVVDALKKIGYSSAGTMEFLREDRREPLFYRDERADSGGTSGDGDGDRDRSGEVADTRGGGEKLRQCCRRWNFAGMRLNAGSMRRIRRRLRLRRGG